MHTNYIQLPPDSTGKKVLVQRVLLITVDDSSLLKKNDIITTSISSNELKIADVVVLGTTHMIHALFTTNASETLADVAIGEKIRINGVDKATVIGPAPYYEFFNLNSLVSFDNPYHGQYIDEYGQAYTRFAEGSPGLDAFGNLRVSNAHMIGAYEFTSTSMGDLFLEKTSNGGQIDYEAHNSQVILSTTSSSGSSADRTTNRYHYYQPGVGNLIIITLALNDSGKTNNIRGWGYGDHHNGLFFRLNGTQLECCMFSSIGTQYTKTATGTQGQTTITVNNNTNIATGMAVTGKGFDAICTVTNINGNTITLDQPLHDSISGDNATFFNINVNAVAQTDWNGDQLDGNGKSQFNLDLTKANFYWIDFAWLGVGPVRFGVLASNGARIVCHTFQNPNNNLGAYMASGSLPLHFHNYNIGATSGPSQLKQICSAVYSESETGYTFWRFSDIDSGIKSVTTNTPILSVRPKRIVNDKINRVGMYPSSMAIVVTGSSDAVVSLSIIDDCTLTGATWAGTSEGLAEYDTAASSVSAGTKFKTFYFGVGAHNIDLQEMYETNDEGYHVLADGSDTYTFNLVATKINGTTANVGASLCYRELR